MLSSMVCSTSAQPFDVPLLRCYMLLLQSGIQGELGSASWGQRGWISFHQHIRYRWQQRRAIHVHKRNSSIYATQ